MFLSRKFINCGIERKCLKILNSLPIIHQQRVPVLLEVEVQLNRHEDLPDSTRHSKDVRSLITGRSDGDIEDSCLAHINLFTTSKRSNDSIPKPFLYGDSHDYSLQPTNFGNQVASNLFGGSDRELGGAPKKLHISPTKPIMLVDYDDTSSSSTFSENPDKNIASCESTTNLSKTSYRFLHSPSKSSILFGNDVTCLPDSVICTTPKQLDNSNKLHKAAVLEGTDRKCSGVSQDENSTAGESIMTFDDDSSSTWTPYDDEDKTIPSNQCPTDSNKTLYGLLHCPTRSNILFDNDDSCLPDSAMCATPEQSNNYLVNSIISDNHDDNSSKFHKVAVLQGTYKECSAVLQDGNLTSAKSKMTFDDSASTWTPYNDEEAISMLPFTSNTEKSTNLSVSQVTESVSSSSNVFIPDVDKSGSAKLYYCHFCDKMVRRYGRHITSVHKDIHEIQEINALAKFSFERSEQISRIRSKAQYIYNKNIRSDGKLLVKYRSSANSQKRASDYIPCPNCMSYYSSNTMTEHYKRCTQLKCIKGVKKASRLLVEKKFPQYLNQVKRILTNAREDQITHIIRGDEFILYFGARLCSKYKFQLHLDSLIRYQMRLLAKLLLNMSSIDPSISNLLQCLNVDQWKNLIAAVMKICRFSSETRKFASPATALHMGTALQNCCTALISHFIETHSDNRRRQIENFKVFLCAEYRQQIAHIGMTNLEDNKRNRPKKIPITSDIIKLNSYIQNYAARAYKILQIGFSYRAWYDLGSYTLIYIILFNRKRTGESERLLIETYKAKQKILQDSDIYQTLTNAEKILSDKFQRMEIRGKWGRNVPILLTSTMISYIDIILKYRLSANVSSENPYIFGLSASTTSHLSATKILRDIASKCGAVNPLTLRGTNLRKQIATMTQVMNLTDNDITLLANYMGHSKLIHMEHYRKADSTLQVVRLSKLLSLFNNGQLHQYKDCSLEQLDEINFESIETDDIDENNDISSDTQVDVSSTIDNFSVIAPTSFVTPTKTQKTRNEYLVHGKSKTSVRTLNFDMTPRLLPNKSPDDIDENDDISSDTQVNVSSTIDNFSVTASTSSVRDNCNLSPPHLHSLPPDFVTSTKTRKTRNEYLVHGKSKTSVRKLTFNMTPRLSPSKSPGRKRKFAPKFAWSEQEIKAVKSLFRDYIKNSILPSRKLCAEVCRTNSALKRRKGETVYQFINHMIKKKIR